MTDAQIREYFREMGRRGGRRSVEVRRARKAARQQLAEHPELARLEALKRRSAIRDAPLVY